MKTEGKNIADFLGLSGFNAKKYEFSRAKSEDFLTIIRQDCMSSKMLFELWVSRFVHH